MSLTPLVFALLGAALGLRVRKGGRGMGLLLSVLAMLAYYLITLGGERLAQAGTIKPFWGGWLATVLTTVCALILLLKSRIVFMDRLRGLFKREKTAASASVSTRSRVRRTSKMRLFGFPGLLDLNVLRTSIFIFALAFFSLVAVFLVFTLFEVWHFIAKKGIGARIVAEYLFFLMPFVSVQLLPASVLIAMLATYALMSRHGESIAWWGSGQSAYRLMLPGLIFAVCIGAGLWTIQEYLMPGANIRQDALRAQIRGEATKASTSVNRQWVASAESGRLYAYEYEEPGRLKSPVVFDFDDSGVHLKRIIKGESAQWVERNRIIIRDAAVVTLSKSGMGHQAQPQMGLDGVESVDVFKPVGDKPSHLSMAALSNRIKALKSRGESERALAVALQERYSSPFSSVVLALTAIPLALSFGRKNTITALCLAIALGLIFWGATGGLHQLGEYGLLPPSIAAWSPITIFAALGIYLLAHART